MSWAEEAKRRAAEAAASHVRSHSVIGLGSGSTATHLIQVIGSLLEKGELTNISGVPTSHQSAADAREAGIPLTSLDEHPALDLAIDGADQIDGNLDAIKGGGGALLREKVVASTAMEYILIADERKLVEKLGDGFPLPIEVLPFSAEPVMGTITDLRAKVSIRRGSGKLGPVVTDNGNFILDADFGPMDDPKWLDGELKRIPGVLETGLFIGYADIVYIGKKDGIERLDRAQ